MPRYMSFSATIEQFKNRSKTVTRRMGWKKLKPGVIVIAAEKCMGLKKGDHIRKLGQIEIISTKWEPLDAITKEECILEGFPTMPPDEFIKMFCKMNS